MMVGGWFRMAFLGMGVVFLFMVNWCCLGMMCVFNNLDVVGYMRFKRDFGVRLLIFFSFLVSADL